MMQHINYLVIIRTYEKQVIRVLGLSDQEVSVIAFYSNDPSSNPPEGYGYSVTFLFGKRKNKRAL